MRWLSKDEALAQIAGDAQALPPGCAGCPLCAMVAAPAHPQDLEELARSPHGVAVLCRYALRRGHIMVVLREHVERIEDLPWAVYQDLQRLAWAAARALRTVLRPVRIFSAALGAPQPLAISFPHVHLHLVPLHQGDERDRPAAVFTFAGGVQVYEDGEAAALAAALRAAWPVEPAE